LFFLLSNEIEKAVLWYWLKKNYGCSLPDPMRKQGTRQLQPSLRTNNPDARSICVCVHLLIVLTNYMFPACIYTFIMNSLLI